MLSYQIPNDPHSHALKSNEMTFQTIRVNTVIAAIKGPTPHLMSLVLERDTRYTVYVGVKVRLYFPYYSVIWGWKILPSNHYYSEEM